jgi:hypothetical protein
MRPCLFGVVVSLFASSAIAQEIALTASPPSDTVVAGEEAHYRIVVTPTTFLTDRTAVLICSGLPEGTRCTFEPPEVYIQGRGSPSELTVETTGVTTTAGPLKRTPWACIVGLAAAVALVLRVRAPRLRGGVRAPRFAAVALLGALVCCDGEISVPPFDPPDPTPPGNYTITVQATTESSTETVDLLLVVQ